VRLASPYALFFFFFGGGGVCLWCCLRLWTFQSCSAQHPFCQLVTIFWQAHPCAGASRAGVLAQKICFTLLLNFAVSAIRFAGAPGIAAVPRLWRPHGGRRAAVGGGAGSGWGGHWPRAAARRSFRAAAAARAALWVRCSPHTPTSHGTVTRNALHDSPSRISTDVCLDIRQSIWNATCFVLSGCLAV
jgi:hypothetical protein